MKKPEFNKNAHLSILISSFIFGLNLPIAKTLLQQDWISPYGMTMMRMAGAAVAFWLFSLFTPKEKVSAKDMWLLLLCSVFGVSANQSFFVVGLASTSPIDSGLIVTTTPIMVMLIAALVLKEPITLKKAIGVIIGAFGAILIVFSSTHTVNSAASFGGDLLCLASCAVYACYLVIVKPITQRYSSVTIMKWMFLFAALMTIPLFYKDVLTARIFTPETTLSAVSRLAYVVLGATFISYLLVPIALKRLRPTTVGMYNYLQPIVATIATIVVGLDVMRWEIPVSAILVFLGVYLVVKSKSRQDMIDSGEVTE